MKRQRGAVDLILVGVAVALLAVICAFIYGMHVGKKNADADWNKREAAINADTANKIKAKNDEIREAERKAALLLADVSDGYQQWIKENDDEAKRERARIVSGERKLYVNARCPAGGNRVPNVAATSSGRDGETRAELSPATAQDIYGVGDDADHVTRQLAAAQALISIYQEQCGAKTGKTGP